MQGLKIWAFRLFAILIFPLLLLVLLEGGLRLLGVGIPFHFTTPCERGNARAYCENNQFSRLFFPPEIAREPRSFLIPASKTPNTYRIFVLGGSAAEGDPEPSYGFSRMLELMLQDQFPQLNFEVINLGMTAINSHVVYQIAKDIVNLEGDLLLVYLGNNEVVGPFGAGTVFSPLSSNLTFIRTSLLIQSTRMGQILQGLLTRWKPDQSVNLTWGGMEMFLQNQVRGTDPGLEIVYQHFQNNLEDILTIAKKKGMKTIVSSVPTNIKNTAPFASLHHPELSNEEKEKWNERYQKGIKLESLGDDPKAIQEFLNAAHIDDQFADLHYRLGQGLWRIGNYQEARQHLIRARDLDSLRFRADTKMNQVITSVSEEREEEGIYFLDAVQLFEENSPYRTPGNNLLFEHVHLNFKGNYLLAKEFVQISKRIIQKTLLKEPLDQPLLTQAEVSNRLAHTGYDRYRVSLDLLQRTRRAPFSNQLDHQDQQKERQLEVKKLSIHTHLDALKKAANQYRYAIQQNQNDPWLYYNFAQLLDNSQNPVGAAELYKRFLLFLPHYYPAHEKVALSLIKQKKFLEAIAHCDEALRIMPLFTPSAFTKSYALTQLGKFEDGIEILQEIARKTPRMRTKAYHEIGQIHIQRKEPSQAADAFQKAIQFHTNHEENPIPDVYASLGFTLVQLGQSGPASQALQKAIAEYTRELKANPNSIGAHLGLGGIWVQTGDVKKATQHFQKAVTLNPNNLNAHFFLINALEAQGRFNEGIQASQKAIQFMRDLGRTQEADKLDQYLKALRTKLTKK